MYLLSAKKYCLLLQNQNTALIVITYVVAYVSFILLHIGADGAISENVLKTVNCVCCQGTLMGD